MDRFIIFAVLMFACSEDIRTTSAPVPDASSPVLDASVPISDASSDAPDVVIAEDAGHDASPRVPDSFTPRRDSGPPDMGCPDDPWEGEEPRVQTVTTESWDFSADWRTAPPGDVEQQTFELRATPSGRAETFVYEAPGDIQIVARCRSNGIRARRCAGEEVGMWPDMRCRASGFGRVGLSWQPADAGGTCTIEVTVTNITSCHYEWRASGQTADPNDLW